MASGCSSSTTETSPESKALRYHSASLVKAISNPLMFSWKLFASEIIEETTKDKAGLQSLTTEEKNSELVSALMKRVEADPRLFHQLVDLLQKDEDKILKSLGEKLKATFRECSSTPLERQAQSLFTEDTRSILPPPAKRFKHSSSPMLHPSIVPPQPHSVLQCYVDYLRAYYQTSELPVSRKWPPTPSKKYINLAVISREEVSREELEKFQIATVHGEVSNILKNKVPIEIQDILDTQQGEILQCVLIEGAPGIGKTTLIWEACKQWGKGKLFQNYFIVMLLRLRDETVQNAASLTDLIFQEPQQEISDHLMKTNGKDMLIILEGLDELPQHHLTSKSIFTSLLAGEKLPQATILVTSRPSATVHLWKNWKERMSRHIEILGFTPQNITDYIESVLPKQTFIFNDYLSMNPRIKSMMYVPINAAIIIEVYRCCQKSDKPLPVTTTDLYTNLTQTILLRYLDSHPEYKEEKFDLQLFTNLPPPVERNFHEMAELAYNGVRNQQLIFHSQHREIQHLGFMDTVTEFFPNRHSVKYSYSFLHLSVQEYLAGYFVSLKCSQEQEQLLGEISTHQHLKNMGKFLVGITKFSGMNTTTVKEAFKRECRKTEDSSLELSTYALQLLHESSYAKIMDSCLSYSYKLMDYNPPFEFSLLGHCIATSGCKWRLQLGEWQHMKSVDRVKMFVEALKSHSNPNCSIENIQCFYDASDCTKQLLLEVPQNILRQIKELRLTSNSENPQLLPECVVKLILSLISRLQKLWLTNGALSIEGLIDVTYALYKNNTLSVLHVTGNSIGDRGAIAIAKVLHYNKTLTVLAISDNEIGDKGAIAIAEALITNRTLKWLYTMGNHIHDSGAIAFADMLESNNELRILDLQDNDIGDDGCEALSQFKNQLALKY